MHEIQAKSILSPGAVLTSTGDARMGAFTVTPAAPATRWTTPLRT